MCAKNKTQSIYFIKSLLKVELKAKHFFFLLYRVRNLNICILLRSFPFYSCHIAKKGSEGKFLQNWKISFPFLFLVTAKYLGFSFPFTLDDNNKQDKGLVYTSRLGGGGSTWGFHHPPKRN